MFDIKPCGNGIIRSHPKSYIQLLEDSNATLRSLLVSKQPFYMNDNLEMIEAVVLQAVKMDDEFWLIEYMDKDAFEEEILIGYLIS